MSTVARITEGGFSGASKCVRWADAMSGEYIVRWRRVLSLILSRELASKKPKSPVWIIAAAFASRASWLSVESLPRMSAIQRMRPWLVSNILVWVFTVC